MEKNNNTALLVMDMQLAMLGRLPAAEAIIKNTSSAINTARENNIPVIYATVNFRPGMPEVSSSNKALMSYKGSWSDPNMVEYLKIHPALAPVNDEVVVIKKRISAFTGSDLEVILRSQEIRNLVLTGISTSGVVLSTLREAADKDYVISVLSDCCADGDDEVHNVLINKIFPKHAEVLTSDEWSELLKK